MPLAALEKGVPWNWETFGEYLDALDGDIAVNAGFLVGHCALRRYVMGADAIGSEATPSSSTRWRACSASRWPPAASGSRPRCRTRTPTATASPSRRGGRHEDELLAPVRRHRRARGHDARGHRRGLPRPVQRRRDRAARRACRVAARRPINWNVLTVDSRVPERVTRQLEASSRAAEAGGRIVALTMPVLVPDEHELPHVLRAQPDPGLGRHPEPARPRAHGQAARSRGAGRDDGAGATARRPACSAGSPTSASYVIGDTYSEANEGLKGRVVAEVAGRARRRDPFDTLIDIVLQRRAAHRAVADAARRRRRHVEAAPGGVAGRPGACSAAPTPAPTSTACAARRTRRASSAT